MIFQKGVAATPAGSEQLEVVLVSNTPKAVKAASTPCSFIWLGAPTAAHTKGATNTSIVLVYVADVAVVAPSAAVVRSGARALATDDAKGMMILTDDAAKVWLLSATTADAVEVNIQK